MPYTLAQQMADDMERVFLKPEEFGTVVTHVPRGQDGFQVNAVWSPVMGGEMIDDDQGRRVSSRGSLIVSLMQVDGVTAVVLDEQGTFVIDGVSWQVGHAVRVSGAFNVEVHRLSQKKISGLGPR